MRILQQAIEPHLAAALSEVGIDDTSNLASLLQRVKEESQGDVALPCFTYAKLLGRAPDEFTAELADAMQATVASESLLAEVHAVGGFLNFRADASALAREVIPQILADPAAAGHAREASALLIEHTSANATGPFHMGRARNPVIGDTLARLLRYNGDEVATEYYVNDMGRQAATLAYGVRHFAPGDAEKVDHALVECYRQANAANLCSINRRHHRGRRRKAPLPQAI